MVGRFPVHRVRTANKLKTEPYMLNSNTAAKGIEACHLLENRNLLIWKFLNNFFSIYFYRGPVGTHDLVYLFTFRTIVFCFLLPWTSLSTIGGRSTISIFSDFIKFISSILNTAVSIFLNAVILECQK